MRPLIDPAASLALHLAAAPGAFALLLGSGGSAPAVPTGQALLRETIARVYTATEGRRPPDDLDLIQWWRDRYGEPTYSSILEAALPAVDARRDYLATFFEKAEPTDTHHELARLAKRGLIRVFITTNFDHLLEQALQREGITATVISLAGQLPNALPREHGDAYILKVHGDYRTGAIRNTPAELAELDPDIGGEFREIVRRYGLIVLGYAGGDQGVMRIIRDSSFRSGLYWVVRSGGAAPGEIQDRASIITAEDGPSFVRDLVRRIDALAAQPEGRLPEEEYREVSAMLRDEDEAAVERRARQLGRRLRDVVATMQADAVAHPDRIPGSISDSSKLASWEPLLVHTFRPSEPALRSYVAAATAAIEQDSRAAGLFAAELVPLFEAETIGGSTFITGIPQIAVGVALNAMLGRAVSLARWSQFAAIASVRGRGRYSNARGVIALNAEVLHPAALGNRADVAIQLAADFLKRDVLNRELALDNDDAANSVANANTLLGVIDRAIRQSDLRPAFWGFAIFDDARLLSRLAEDSDSLDPLARLAGEEPSAFRHAFAQRFQDELSRHSQATWPFRDRPSIVDELTAISGRPPSTSTGSI